MRLGPDNLSCENEFYLRENEKWFPYQRLSTYPRFETEAWENSEVIYCFGPRKGIRIPESGKFLLVESGIQQIFAVESGIQLNESGIPLTIRIRNPDSAI